MKRLFTILLAAVAIAGCSDDDQSETTSTIRVTDEAQLNQTFYADDTENPGGDFQFSATENWTTKITDQTPAPKSTANATPWVTLFPANGNAGTVNMKITLTPNQTESDRKAGISIICGATTITITIEQKAVPRTSTAKKVKSITYYDINNGDPDMTGPEELYMRVTYEYDAQGRVTKIISSDPEEEGADEVGTITYENDKITYSRSFTDAGKLSTSKSIATVNNSGMIQNIVTTSQYGTNAPKTKTEELTYTDGLMTSSTESDDDVNTLTWTNGNLAAMVWQYGENQQESYNITYGTKAVSAINLDLNWLLYPGEGMAFVGGGDGGTHPFATQGFCGKKNSTFMTGSSISGRNSEIRQIKEFEYDFDENNCPIAIRMYSATSAPKFLEERMEITYY